MSAVCQLIGPFFDDELAPDDAGEFRDHLTECKTCEDELHDLMQFGALEAEAPKEKRRPATAAPRTRKRLWGFGMLTASIAVALTVFVATRGTQQAKPLGFNLAATRSIEGRFSYAGADQYRPYDVQRSGAGDAPENISLATLAELERRGDESGLFAGYLLSGNRKQAATILESREESADLLSDQALLLLRLGDTEKALDAVTKAIDLAANHPQALWNRALVLRQLGLPLGAARDFLKVASLDHTGWSTAAKKLASDLQREFDDGKTSWQAAQIAGTKLQEVGELPSDELRERHAAHFRIALYTAARAAPSKARLLQLMPLASHLDKQFGGAFLANYIQTLSKTNFAARAPLAKRYADLVADKKLRVNESYLVALRQGSHRDILLGALELAVERNRTAGIDFTELRGLARTQADPWHRLEASRLEGNALIYLDGNYARAETRLQQGLSVCEKTALTEQCARLRLALASLYSATDRFALARSALAEARVQALSTNNYLAKRKVLDTYLQLADDRTPGGTEFAVLVQAIVEERILGGISCRGAILLRVGLAYGHFAHNRISAARVELDTVRELRRVKCPILPNNSTGLRLNALYLAAQLTSPTDGNRARFLRAELQDLRKSPSQPWQSMMLDFAEGRFLLDSDHSRGEALLRKAIYQADKQSASNPIFDRVRSDSLLALASGAASRGNWHAASSLLAEQLRLPVPTTCAMGIFGDRDFTVVSLDHTGNASGFFRRNKEARLGGQPPVEVHDAMSLCDEVDVLATPGYYGQPGLIPDTIAWRFRSALRRSKAVPVTEGKRLVIFVPNAPAGLHLPRLRRPSADSNATWLEGNDANPRRVLEAMSTAASIEVHAHGLLGESAASALVLAPDRSGDFTLDADKVASTELAGAPGVFLAACHAGKTVPGAHRSWGLADAFLKAGASYVIASPAPVQDAQADAFFQDIRGRIARGSRPSQALRDARMHLSTSWSSKLVVFE